MSVLFNQICINEKMQPKHTHTHTHTHTHIYIYIYIYIYHGFRDSFYFLLVVGVQGDNLLKKCTARNESNVQKKKKEKNCPKKNDKA